jgi:hypothetical protein
MLKTIAADAGTAAPETMALPTNLFRRPQMRAPEHTSALSKRVKAEQFTTTRKASAPEDDPVGVPLLAKHRMKLFYEKEGPKKERRTYRVLDVRHLPKRPEWVTCSAPVEKTAAGQWEIPAQHLVQGEGNADAVVKVTSCQHHVLADVTGPLNVLYGDCVDACIKAHENGESDPSRSGKNSDVPPPKKKKLKRKR